MAASASPYGLKPINLVGGQAFSGGTVREFAMTTNSATAIGFGTVITLNGGQPSAITATPTTTRGTSTPIGVCVGMSYNKPAPDSQPTWGQYLPANAVNSGYTNIKIMVVADPDQLYQVQSAGSITQASVGLNVVLETFTANANTGVSQTRIGATPASTATLAMRIVDLVVSPSSTPGDAFTDCIVKFNHGVHAYTNSTGG